MWHTIRRLIVATLQSAVIAHYNIILFCGNKNFYHGVATVNTI